jgi:RHS repeat-associated protein
MVRGRLEFIFSAFRFRFKSAPFRYKKTARRKPIPVEGVRRVSRSGVILWLSHRVEPCGGSGRGSRVTQRTDSAGGVLTYGYDNANRLTAEEFGGTGQTQAGVSLAYDAADRMTNITRYSDAALTSLVGTTAYSFDNAGRVTAITNQNASAATLSYYDYTFDNADRVSAHTWSSTTATTTLSGAYTYSYDATNQLSGDGTATFSYDPNGNRTMAGYQTGGNNRVTNDGTWTYTYDAVGDITQKSKGAGLETWYYEYDTLNRLTSIQQTSNGTALLLTVTYTYDVYGHRYKEQDWQSGGSVTTTYSVFDGSQAWADLNGSLAATTRYLWGTGSQDLYARIDVGVGLRQVSQDRLGSVRDVWDGGGVALDHIEYGAYGIILSETTATIGGVVLYDGLRQNRATGTVDTDNRTLFVTIGRWAQKDPIWFSAGDPNLYRSVGNSPTNATDPSGLLTILVHGVDDNGDAWAPDMQKGLTGPLKQPVLLFTWTTPDHERPGLLDFSTSVAGMPRYEAAEAERLKNFIVAATELFKRYNIHENINIVAHSQGTLIALKALQLGAHVNNAVFLASPLSWQNGAKDIEAVRDQFDHLTLYWNRHDQAVATANWNPVGALSKEGGNQEIAGLEKDKKVSQQEITVVPTGPAPTTHMGFVQDQQAIGKYYADKVGTPAIAPYDTGTFNAEWEALLRNAGITPDGAKHHHSGLDFLESHPLDEGPP